MMKFLVASLAFCALIGQLYAQTAPTTTRDPLKKLEREIGDLEEALHDEIKERALIQMCSLPVAARMFVNGLRAYLEIEGPEGPDKRGFELGKFTEISETVGKVKQGLEKLAEFCGPEEPDKREQLDMKDFLEKFLKLKNMRNGH